MTKFKHTPNKQITDTEGNQHWISRSVAVVGLVVIHVGYSKYVLVGKRGKGAADYQGKWNLPCGYLDWDETGAEACLREIYEETGLDIKKWDKNNTYFHYSTQPLLVKTDPSNNRQNVSLYYEFWNVLTSSNFELLKTFLNTSNSEEDEVEELRFIDLDELDDLEFCFGHDEIIKKVLTFNNANFDEFE